MKYYYYIITPLLFLLLGCKQNDSINTGGFTDHTGLVIYLEWSLPNSTNDPIDAVNLDLSLLYNNFVYEESRNDFSFEKLKLRSTEPDGTYYIDIRYLSGSEALQYDLVIEGESSFRKILLSGELFINDVGGTYQVLRIQKQGNDFVLN